MNKEEQWLISQGFKRKWFDDKSGYWFVKKLKHSVLKSLEIVVELDTNVLYASCKEIGSFSHKPSGYVDVFYDKYCRNNVKWLEKNI